MGAHFRRQHPVFGYIPDFVSLEHRIIIEIDGGYHQLPTQQLSDAERTVWLEKMGFKIIRFTNEEVLFNLEETIRIIKENIK